jgi:hypothetical protein
MDPQHINGELRTHGYGPQVRSGYRELVAVKIEVKFTRDRDNEGGLEQMVGKTITMEHVDQSLDIAMPVDIFPDGNGGKVPGGTGILFIRAHGNRAVWSE